MAQTDSERGRYHFIASGEFWRFLGISIGGGLTVYGLTTAAGFQWPEAWGPWAITTAVGAVNVAGSAGLAYVTGRIAASRAGGPPEA